MALKTFVVINNVNNLSDARYCAGMGVDVIGFSLNPAATDYVDPQKFKEITGWLAGVRFAGDCEGLEINTIQKLPTNYKLDYLLVSEPSYLEALSDMGLPVILKINIEILATDAAADLLSNYPRFVEYFLIESANPAIHPDTIKKIDDIAAIYPVLAGFAASADDVSYLLANTSIKGISLKGGNEIKPGFKDYDELAEILEAIEVD